ncbi:hypothetical protein CDD81_2544 [Ophiocordyceps australis]|uniref:Uncharacterized protein n=1 Tax=Ophiocordyceps australis TaxID=1399860 RepID=A0A2C5YD86_9HYPO|nr:hypothetical protein CDD81_2544 [Ophiocordyceps australis]
MARKARQKISYVLENANSSTGGHRLGVNGLAFDPTRDILYSGGRDGIVCAWDVSLGPAKSHSQPQSPSTRLRARNQAHMHWINDIVLAQNYTALVSASSDLAVKLWRPHSEEDNTRAQPIGAHDDYVKCVASPPADINASWVASGGLDRKICLWDLNGGGKSLEIDVRGEEISQKGSVYALAVGRSLVACGGPTKTVRLYDTRSGSRVSKLVGHLDNIRSILIDDADDTILSSSADKTVKMWSVRGGRCMYTFTMHDESVWSLHSNDPRLGIFYSSDRSGLVVKTDVRGSLDDMDNGLSLALASEHTGVPKVLAARGQFWTATDRSSINRWADVDMDADLKLPEPFRRRKAASGGSRQSPARTNTGSAEPLEVASASILRISNTANYPSHNTPISDSRTANEATSRRCSDALARQPEPETQPIRETPNETIEGQFGLLKYNMLNDRRRVLTLDTAGEVLLWDLVTCKPVQKFGKQNLEDVQKVVNTREAVAPWCSIDLSAGNLMVELDPFNCFDAEVYADELKLDEPIEFKDDQRISLGRWVLRYLFGNLVEEEIKRDNAYRSKLNAEIEKRLGATQTGASSSSEAYRPSDDADETSTLRAAGSQTPGVTTSLSIGVAAASPAAAAVFEASAVGEKDDEVTADATSKAPVTPATDTSEPKSSIDNGGDKAREKGDSGKSSGTPFGKKFRIPFASKKQGRSPSQPTQDKPVVVEDKAEGSESSSSHEKEVDDSLYGVIQKIHNQYEKQLAEAPDKRIETLITASPASETPPLMLPRGTLVIIKEERLGGSANVYQGTVGDVGRDADMIEHKAPMWLGNLLLQNMIPPKDQVKVSFILNPMDSLPPLSGSEGCNRLNANRMLRVKKILDYVANRIEEPTEEEQPNAMSAEEYLELYCNDQLLDPAMSLATIRAHVWKGGNDVVMYYKANGRKTIKPVCQPFGEPPLENQGGATQTTGAESERDATQLL